MTQSVARDQITEIRDQARIFSEWIPNFLNTHLKKHTLLNQD
jgi:hypothetical protein